MANDVLARLSALLTLDAKGFKAGLNQAGKQAEGFNSMISKLGPAVAGAFSTAAIINYSKEAVTLAGKAEGIKEAFDRIADASTLMKLKEATRGTVSEMELMKNAVKANNFKIPLEQLATFFDFATKRAAQTGESVDYLVESIILGIGRKSPLILDNLGISAIELREKLKGVGMESASIGDVTRAMGEVVDGELKRMGDVTTTTGQKMQQLSVIQDELQTNWGKFLIKLGNTTNYGGGIQELSKSVEALTIGLDGVSFDNFGDAVDIVTNIMLPLKGIKAIWDMLREGSDEMAQTTARANALSDAIKGDKEEADALAKSLESKGVPATEATQRANDLMYQSLLKARSAEELSDEQWELLTGQIAAFEKILYPTTEAIEVDAEALAKQAKAAEDAEKAMRKLNAESMKKITGGLNPVTTDELMGSGAMTDQQNKILEAMQTVGSGRISGMQLPTEQVKELDLALKELPASYTTTVDQMTADSERLQGAFEAIGESLGTALGEFMKGEAKFDEVVGSLLQSIIKVVAGYLTQTVAASFAGGASSGGPAAPFTGAAAAAAALSMFGAIVPALMAEGGTVPGGYPGDTYPAMLTSGETVIPPHKLDMMGGPTEVYGTIRGQDIYLSNQRHTSKRQRYT
jgi:hypothetical protein